MGIYWNATENEMMYRLPFSDPVVTEAIYPDMLKNFIFPQMEEEDDKFSNKMVHRTLLATFRNFPGGWMGLLTRWI
jgi:hypothetical protein